MELRIYDKQGIKNFADFDLMKFIDLLQKEQRMLKGKGQDGPTSCINGTLEKCIRAATPGTDQVGTQLDKRLRIEI